jgi:branched-chain amino acid transport system permease protein
MNTRRLQLIIAVAIFVIAALLPLVVQVDYTLQVMFRVLLFAALGLAWNLVGGYAGQLSLGHAAYFGIGAYGLALFARAGLPIVLAMLLSLVMAAISAAIIGAVSFRLRGPYFALCTIAFAEVLRLVAKNISSVTGGDVGVQVPLLFPNHTHVSFYYAALGLAIVGFFLTFWIERAKFGYYLMAIREDEDTALSVGVNTPVYKMYALLISAVLTAIGGALYASLFLYIVPDQVLSMEISTEVAIVAMLGGAGMIIGPIVGSLVLESAGEIFKAYFQEANLLIYGVLVIVVVLFMPEGIVGTIANKVSLFKPAPVAPLDDKAREAAKEAERVTAAQE